MGSANGFLAFLAPLPGCFSLSVTAFLISLFIGLLPLFLVCLLMLMREMSVTDPVTVNRTFLAGLIRQRDVSWNGVR